jgi:hypothetical protein
VRQPESIHRSRHLDVRKHQADSVLPDAAS